MENRALKRTFTYAASLCCALALYTAVFAQKRQVHILATNDMHAQIEVFPQLAALIDSLRTIDPSLLVFSAGDNRTGNPLNDKFSIPGYPMVALMNQTGFNASAIGNHEFDVRSLGPLTGLSNFRYICANAFPDDTTGIRIVPTQVFDVEGLKVGVVGAIQLSPQGIPSTHPDNIRGIRFTPPLETVSQYEKFSRQCDVTILLSHVGYEDDRRIAEACPWLDLIIGGHTHTQLKGGERSGGVPITQNKNKFGNVTYITLSVDSGHVVDCQTEYINIKKYPKKDSLILAMVQHFSDNAEFRRVLATAETPFEVREELGCMICDALIDEFNADIAVENPGGVRIDSHPIGEITVLDILEMDPFDNNAVVLTLNGKELLDMMLSYCHNTLLSFPYVGGMKCEITTEKDNPKKIKSVRLLTLDGKKLDMKKKYRVVTNNYITATSQIPEGSAQPTNNLTTDLIMNYLQRKGSVSYQGVRRLKVVNGK